ncbi:MAG: thioredoxin [Deltaproteobacteria bacterium]|nr:MAG: thioredoxin [Deltaproteobacteria bacterium]
MASDKVHQVTDDNFDAEVLQSDIPVLLDFTATWCGPCKRIAPLIDALADKTDGRLKVCKIDIDDNPRSPMKYGIRGVPTLMLFKGGEKVAQHVGALNGAQLDDFVRQVL